jgi:pimeloyl-ACP methyl ester carboxylesterase
VVGWSAGGRVALALAARHPDVVRSVAVVCTPAPDDEVAWVPEEYRTMSQAMGSDPAAVGAPVTLFYGDGDPVVTPEHGRYWDRQLAASELRVIRGAGHLLPVTEWGQILASVI